MKKGKLKRIEAKAKLGMPLTEQEKAYYIVFSRVILRVVVDSSFKA